MGIEVNSFFVDLSQNSKRKYLESTAVGKDWSVPGHKLMETTHITDDFVAGANMKVVGIGQFNLTVYCFKVMRGKAAFDGSLSSDVHKNRSLNCPVRCNKLTSAGSSFLFQ